MALGICHFLLIKSQTRLRGIINILENIMKKAARRQKTAKQPASKEFELGQQFTLHISEVEKKIEERPSVEQEKFDTDSQYSNYFEEIKRIFKKNNEKKVLTEKQQKFMDKVKSQDQEALQKITYPHTRKEVNKMFMEKTKSRTACSLDQAKYVLKKELLAMGQYGYDFRYKQWHFKDTKDRDVRRKVYIRLECLNCREYGGIKKRWTSIVGTAEVKYRIVDLSKFLKKHRRFIPKGQSISSQVKGLQYSKVVLWSLKIYSMQCKDCRQYGKIFIYQKQIQALSKSFCIVLAEKLANRKPIPHQDNREKKNIDMHKHEQELCEACKLKKCFNIPKGENKVVHDEPKLLAASQNQAGAQV